MDGTARVWDAASGQPVTPPFRHGAAVGSASFSPDGRRLVTACADGKAWLWEVAGDGRPVADLKALAELISGQGVDATEGLFGLPGSEWRARRDALWKKYPAGFRPRPDWVYLAAGIRAVPPAGAPAFRPVVWDEFYFDYRFQPMPGYRWWVRDRAGGWAERYPDGHTAAFSEVGVSDDPDYPGLIVRRGDGMLEVLIPPAGESARFRYRPAGTLPWTALADVLPGRPPAVDAATQPATEPTSRPATRPVGVLSP